MHHLAPLTAEEIAALEQACSRVLEVGADQDILCDEDRPTDSNLLLEGWVCRYKILPSGTRQILSFQFPGDIFDAQSFILDRMDHSIGTITPCRLGVIPHKTLLCLTEAHPRIARAIWKDTLVDAAVFREWMISIGRRDAYARIAHMVCEIFVRLEAVGLAAENSIDWPITQSEIGDALGLSSVHLNRSLMALRGAKLITLTASRLVIHDWEGLRRAGQFDPAYLHMSSRLAKGRSSNVPAA